MGPTTLNLLGTEPPRILAGLEVGESENDNHFILERLTRREIHSDVYALRKPGEEDVVNDTEARAFMVDGVPPKVRRHRLRCVKRLGNRMLLQTQNQDTLVVVYRTGLFQQNEDVDATDISRGLGGIKIGFLGQIRASSSPKSDEHTKGIDINAPKELEKTQYQRESGRVRQLERRRAKREAAALEKGSLGLWRYLFNNPPRGRIPPLEIPTFQVAILLYLVYDDEANLRSTIPSAMVEILAEDHLGDFLLGRQIVVTNAGPNGADTTLVLKGLKRRFERLKLQMKELTQMSYRRLFSGTHETLKWFIETLQDSSSEELREMGCQLATKPNLRLDILLHIENVLPQLIEGAQKSSRLLEQMIEVSESRISKAVVKASHKGQARERQLFTREWQLFTRAVASPFIRILFLLFLLTLQALLTLWTGYE